MNIAVLDDYQEVALEMTDWTILPPSTRVVVFSEHLLRTDTVAEQLKDFEIVVAMREQTLFPRELLERLPNLQFLVTTGMRNASIDLDAATDLGILVCGTRGGGPSTAELAWGLILTLLRHIPQENTSILKGHWQTTIGTELKDKVLGVLGLGRLGSHIAAIGNAFGMSVIAWSQNLTVERAALKS